MTDLHGLIRYHKWRLDEKQRALAELRNREDQILADAARLEDAIKAEQQTAGANYEVAFGYGNFARAAIGRREVKTYELAQAERDKREAEERRHKENLDLDETAQIGHRRRQEQNGEPE